MPERNDRLAHAMNEAGLSNKALARAVRELSQRQGHPISCDHTSVSRWLSGTRPRGEAPRLVAAVLSSRIGRIVSPAEIGLSASSEVPATLGTAYEQGPGETADVLARLWRADLDDIRTVVEAPAHAAAGAEAALAWLVRPGSDLLPERGPGARVGAADIAVAKATVDSFAALDNRYGGGQARKALIQYLDSHMAALLRGCYSEQNGRELYAAASEATLLAAWMSYDSGVHGLAQRYFIQALRLAQAADDVLLAGSILDAMSHQATFLGRSHEAANLARAARTGTQGKATATLTAHFHAMEARALACGGDCVGSQKALSEAVRVFERRQPGDDPEWISYFDDAELSAEFGHCFRDIGRHADAVTYAQRSLANAGASVRSDFFVTMVLAAGHLGQGNVEEACATAQTALEIGDQVKSARCVEYLRQFRRSLQPFITSAAARALADNATDHVLWIGSTP